MFQSLNMEIKALHLIRSTDLLQQLHIPTTKVANVAKQVSKTHLAFISAMESYPIMKYIQPIRKLIHEPTIFNIVGPLINPFKLDYQVMGYTMLPNYP